MEFLSIACLVVGIILCGYGYYKINHLKEIDKTTEEENKKILENYNNLLFKQQNLIDKINILEEEHSLKTGKLKELNELTADMNKSAAAAFEQYVDTLDQVYTQKEEEFTENMNLLDDSYAMAQMQYIEETEKVKAQLDNLKATRAAAIEAQRQERLIKENKNKFSLYIDDMYKNDVYLLERIKKDFSNPRIISMLIWQTYFRDLMTDLCAELLGSKTICGIYKITNQLTDECYIGQSVDVAKRWKDHAKCGLDIDRPQGNKLYQAMKEDGIWNFTWELLEECSRDKLNEKEKYFIELYQSDKYGYNSTGGNK